jgi:hypothetical protein
MKKISAVVIAALIAVASVSALAHSGGTDSKGCHRNHKTGDYHCHRAQPTQSRQTSNSYSAASESISRLLQEQQRSQSRRRCTVLHHVAVQM